MGEPRALNDISFVKTNGGLGRYNGSDDAISGLIFGGLGLSFAATQPATEGAEPMPADVAGFDAVDANTYVRRFTYPEELADLGIVFTPTPSGAGQAKQEAKNVLYYHITEFFRMNPEGVLYVMVKTDTLAATDITALQTFAGTARLALETGTDPAELRGAVCSPAGSTHSPGNGLCRGTKKAAKGCPKPGAGDGI